MNRYASSRFPLRRMPPLFLGKDFLFVLLQVLRANDDSPSWAPDHFGRLDFLRRFRGILRWILCTICRCLLLKLHTLPSSFGMCVPLRYEDGQSVAWILVHNVVVTRIKIPFHQMASLDIPVTTLVYHNTCNVSFYYTTKDVFVHRGAFRRSGLLTLYRTSRKKQPRRAVRYRGSSSRHSCHENSFCRPTTLHRQVFVLATYANARDSVWYCINNLV